MHKRLRSLRFIALAGLLFAAACSGLRSSDPEQLEGTRWKLVNLDVQQPLPDTEITAEFNEGVVGGTSSCNSYSGTYQLDAETIEVGEMTMTLMACIEPEGIMEQEQLYLQYLGNAQTFAVDGDQLTIGTADGKTLTFSAIE
jgi:heat shock protein HslJ